MIELLDKAELIVRNKELRYPLAVAEKDYFLALVLSIIYNSPLKDKLVFKGGTALHHVYLPQLRFSEDLDFSSPGASITLEEMKKIVSSQDFLTIKKEYSSSSTLKIEKLSFVGPLGQENSLKIEIDCLQNVVLPTKNLWYNNEYGVEANVRVMDIREIAAEKIRAMNDRVRYRDFYDFSMIFLKLDVSLEEVLSLIGRKEVRNDINPQNIMSNWAVAKKDKKSEISTIFFKEEVDKEETTRLLKKLNFSNIKKNIEK